MCIIQNIITALHGIQRIRIACVRNKLQRPFQHIMKILIIVMGISCQTNASILDIKYRALTLFGFSIAQYHLP
jgi:integral membrane sensor domain MASE1